MDASAPPAQLPPLEDAKRQYVELFGSALVMNTYLKIALLCVSLIAVGLLALNYRTQMRYEHLKPLVIRIDDIGRTSAVAYDSMTYQPRGQAPELKYFLMQFVAKHFARIRSAVKEQYAESLYFLDEPLADAAIADDRRTQAIDTFLTGTSDETDIQIKNVTLDALTAPPYKASVDFEKVFYGIGNHQERGRERFIAQLTFVLRDQIPNALVPVNPLGVTVTYIRVDQAFQMIANSAFLAAMVMMLLVFLLMGELEFLAPYKRVIFSRHLTVILGAAAIVFLNLFSVCYLAARALFLKETGRKLAHVEKQLRTGDTIVRDLSERLAQDE